MSFTKIENAVSTAKGVIDWNAYLIEYNHKRKPNEYIFYDFHFDSNDLLVDTINSMCDVFMKSVETYDRRVIDYTADNPKNIIDKISTDNFLIAVNWNKILNCINYSNTDVELKNIKASAYMFVGNYSSDIQIEKRIYLLTVKNPILNFTKRSPVFTTNNNKVTNSNEPLVQFKKSFDAIIYDGILYSINNSFENVFNMEYSHKIVCREKLERLEEADIIVDMDSYRDFAVSGFYPKKFTTYNECIVEKLKRDEGVRRKLSEELQIPLDPTTNKFDLSNPVNARNFTLAICDKTKQNMFDDGVCEVSSSTPIRFI